MNRPIRIVRTLALAPLILAGAACDTTGPDIRSHLQSQLDSQEARWADSGTGTYTLRTERHCECTNQYDVALNVVDGVAVSGVHAFSGDPLTPAELDAQLTVADLFAVVQDAIDRRVAALAVQYNQEFGYVQRLRIDYDGRTVTDDVEFIVTEFTPDPDA